jgi:peptide/nickel transport system substrate-binding protein
MKNINRLQQLLATGDISRRSFIKQLSALGITAAVSTNMMAGIASAATTPKKGGRLRIGMSGGHMTDSLEPGIIGDHMPMLLQWQLKNNLVEVDENNKTAPELAERWEASKDAKTWVFDLRRGVEFHNGKSFEAEDVIYSMNIHRGEKSKSAGKTYANQIKALKADGKHRVIFTLKEGNADFHHNLSTSTMPMVPAGEKDFSIGTGGYTLVNFEPGVSSMVKRNPNYWKEGRAHFDEIETLCINDTAARTNALKTGEIDVMSKCDKKTVHLLAKTRGLQIIHVPGSLHHPFPMRTDQHPYSNNDVRLALKYGVDRQQMVDLILNGYGKVGNDHPLNDSYRYYATFDEVPQRKYDPDKARYHLKKAGMENETFTLYASEAAFSGGTDAAVLYKEQASKAGIKIEVVRSPADGYWDDVWMKKGWTQSYYSGVPNEDWMFSMAYGADAEWNETFWKHKRFNQLLKEARITLDGPKRRDLYVEMQRIMWKEGGTVIPIFADSVDAASDKVKFGKVSGSRELDTLRCSERWWFDS